MSNLSIFLIILPQVFVNSFQSIVIPVFYHLPLSIDRKKIGGKIITYYKTDWSVIMNKKKLILTVAEKIISEKGYSNTTIEEITKRAKIGKGTFYNYFKNKEELFYLIIKEGLDNLVIEIKDSIEDIDDFFERIKMGIEMYLKYHQKHFYFFKILIQEKPFLKNKKFINFWEDFFDRWDFIKKDLKKQIERNKIVDIEPDDILYSLLGILHGNIHKWHISGRKYCLVEKKDAIFNVFINGIRRK